MWAVASSKGFSHISPSLQNKNLSQTCRSHRGWHCQYIKHYYKHIPQSATEAYKTQEKMVRKMNGPNADLGGTPWTESFILSAFHICLYAVIMRKPAVCSCVPTQQYRQGAMEALQEHHSMLQPPFLSHLFFFLTHNTNVFLNGQWMWEGKYLCNVWKLITGSSKGP